MILSRFFRSLNVANLRPAALAFLSGDDLDTLGTTANLTTAQRIHTAYRCINILSDDIASMPLQTFETIGKRLAPTSMPINISWLLENEPNRWTNPFIFKKTVTKWMINYGQAFIWYRPLRGIQPQELIVLPSDRTVQMFDTNMNLWYQVAWQYWEPEFDPLNNPKYYPDVEVAKLLLNSDDGLTGNSVLTFARETLSRQLGNFATQNRIAGKGLNPSGIAWMSGELNKEARKEFKKTYEETMHDSGIAIFDPKVTKFESITMKPVDAQFLEIINATDVQICNFYGVPLYKLNSGKQSYESNAQQNEDYLKTTLNPYLIQWESEGKRKWLTEEQLNRGFYHKYNRDVILATDAKTRAEYLERKILSGQYSPNEARRIDDVPPYIGGDKHYIPANMVSIENQSVSISNLLGGEDDITQAKDNGNERQELTGTPGNGKPGNGRASAKRG